MSSEVFYNYFLIFWIAFPVLLLPLMLRVVAPYGRHVSEKWGWMIDNRLGWMVMELVSPTVFAFYFLSGSTFSMIMQVFVQVRCVSRALVSLRGIW